MNRISIGSLSAAFLVLIAGVFLYGLGEALLPLLIATFLAYLLLPLIQKLEARGVSKELALGAAVGVAAILLLAVLLILVPILAEDLKAFLSALPRIAESFAVHLDELSQRFGVSLPLTKDELTYQARIYLSKIPAGTLKSVGLFFGKAATDLAGFILSVLNLILIPIFFYYIISDYRRLATRAREFVPPRFRSRCDDFIVKAKRIFSAYFRGQLFVSLILGVLFAVGFSIAGLRFGFLIGILAGLLNVVPIAGPVISVSIASVVALASSPGSYGALFTVWLIFAIVQGLEGFVITPRIIGDKVGLNALETMLALIIGGNLGGITGMLLAIPVAAILRFVLKDAWNSYRKSEIYQ